MATPVVPWSELEAPFAHRNELPGVSRFQEHYACYHNKGFASTETDYLQARFGSQQGDTWLTVRLRIYVAPAETVLPIKKDRQFSPEFQVQVEVQSKRPITFEGTVHAFALNEQQKNELTVGLGEGSRLPRSVSDSLLASAQGQPKPGIHPFKGTCSVPVSIAFEPEVISSLPKEHIAKKVADATFSKLEFKNPSNMEPRYILFAIAVGTSAAAADVSAVLFTPPTISICRGVQQRNKATKKLGYLNPDDMYAAVASRGGEAYKTKAGAHSKRSSVTDATHVVPADIGTGAKLGIGADSVMQDGEGSGSGAQVGRNPGLGTSAIDAANTSVSDLLHDKFWRDASGGNRVLQNPSIDAATATIFGHAPFASSAAANQDSGRPIAKDIAKLFPRATSLASNGYEAVPMTKPTSMSMGASGVASYPLPVPAASNADDKTGVASTSTPFDAPFGVPELLSSLPFNPASLQLNDRGQTEARDEGDAFLSSLNMIPDGRGNRRQVQPTPDVLAKGYNAFHPLGTSGSTADPATSSNPRLQQQQRLAQAPPLFTGMPGTAGSSHAASHSGRAALGGAARAGDKQGARSSFPESLQGIARQVAAVGLGGNNSGAGIRSDAQASQQTGAPARQQPVESPFGGPPGAGISWQISSGSLGESFDPLMALELLDSRAADVNAGIFNESQPMNMDVFSSFAPSLDMAQAAAAASHVVPTAPPGASREPTGLERSRPVAPEAAHASAAYQQRQNQPVAPDTQNAYFGADAHGGAAACPRDRERSFPIEGLHTRGMQSADAAAQSGGGLMDPATAGIPPPPPLSFPTPGEDDKDEHLTSTSFPILEMSFDFACLEAPSTSSMPGHSNSREEGTTGKSSTGAPSVNLTMDAEMDMPDAADRGLVGAQDASASGAFVPTVGTITGLEDIYAAVPHEHAAEADGGALRANLCAVGAVSLAERN